MSPWRRAQMMLLWLGARTAGRISVRLGGWLSSALWFTPWPTATTPRSRHREAQWLRSTSPLTLVVDGLRLEGYAAGRGPTVLLVHGWGDRAARMGAFVGPFVSAGYRVVALDLPGHGRAGVRRTDLPTLSDAIRAAVGQLGPVHAVIGHSMGATAAILAARDGLETATLVALAPPVRLRHAVDRFRQMLALPEPAVVGLQRSIERRFGMTVWERYAADRVPVDLPTLIVHDRDDAQVDLADARTLAAAWPDARLVETAGLGHQRIVRDPQVVESVVSFVGERTQAAGRAMPA